MPSPRKKTREKEYTKETSTLTSNHFYTVRFSFRKDLNGKRGKLFNGKY